MQDTPTDQPPSPNVFPLVRHISARLTPLLYRSPLSANHVTFISMLLGLGAAWSVGLGSHGMDVLGGVLLVACYVLDNCDGEIARLKGQSSEFGRRFDNFVDWVVHTAFFAALGWGVTQTSGQQVWLWLGGIAAAGSTINYVIGTIAEEREAAERSKAAAGDEASGATGAKQPETWRQWIMFAFRELSRADFCFIVMGLAIFGQTWLLLPFGAIGAQAFWAVHLAPGAREHHV
ncbi:MAG: CDP-alcohol phosphatidyltransferase family protein [Proteobacteria bacterium]|nr:CDP-alcohol phosphatidyltransferase family protein [Pseudomonadota bacterium]